MKNIKEPISHYHRINTRCEIGKRIEPRPTIRRQRVQSVNVEDSRVITKLQDVTVDRCEEMKPYKVSDFALENLIAIGAEMQVSHLTASPHKAITDMAETLSTISEPQD